MTATLDTVPNDARIRAAAGATLNVQVELQLSDGDMFDTTGGTVLSEIVDRSNANGTPPVTAFATSITGSVISLSLTSSQTTQLRGTWHYRLWLALPGPTRYLVCHGDLEVVAP